MHDRSASSLRHLSGPELARNVRSRLLRVALLANGVAVALVAVFLLVLVPAVADRVDTALHLDRVTAALLVYVGLAPIAGSAVLQRRWRRTGGWLDERRPPDERERAAVLREPLGHAAVVAAGWGGAAVLFAALEAPASLHSAADVGVTIALGGLSAAAATYLVAERSLRPVAARALAERPPATPVMPGITTRLLAAWCLGTGVALFGLVLVSMGAFFGEYREPQSLARVVLFLTAVGAAGGLAALAVAAHSVADRVAGVRHAMALIDRGDLSARVAADDGSEVGLLQAGFNRMAAGLEERERLRDLFGRHVGEDVARAALERGGALGGEVRDVAVLFVDLVGSTQLAARRPPSEVVALLNRFFAEVVDAVEQHGGWINKFEGDAALAVFGAPEPRPDPAGAALAAARQLRRRLQAAIPEVDAGIGVSAGPAVAGNVGTERRFEYTVIGDPVNEAARLCELAKRRPSRLLASGRILDAAVGNEPSRWRRGDSLVLRGRDDATELAEPVGGA